MTGQQLQQIYLVIVKPVNGVWVVHNLSIIYGPETKREQSDCEARGGGVELVREAGKKNRDSVDIFGNRKNGEALDIFGKNGFITLLSLLSPCY